MQPSPAYNQETYPLSAYNPPHDTDDSTTLHTNAPHNSSRTHLVGRDMEYRGEMTPSDDEHQTPKGKATFKEEKRPEHASRRSSWDALTRSFKHEFEGFEFKTSTAKEEHLRFAEGDFSSDPASRFYSYLLNLSIITRWALYIIPMLGLLWIPGILGYTAFKEARMAGVPLVYWSIWFTVVWGGWWGCFAAAKLLPYVLRSTVAIVAVSLRKYVEFFVALQRYVALVGWSIAIWSTFGNPLMTHRDSTDNNPNDTDALSIISHILEAIFISSTILAIEKFAIQYIALIFHQTTFADRITEQKMNTRFLVALYRNSTNIPGRFDTMNDDQLTIAHRHNPKKVLKDILHSMRSVAETTTTALGNIATEIAGASVLQPNSPEGRVSTALNSANKSRLLARRLYYSFRQEGHKCLVLNDIARFFDSFEEAQLAFNMFDKDGNGDVTRDEMEMACVEVHRERLNLTASMRNIDSAVGRLDSILTYLWMLVAILILIACLDTTLYTSLSAFGGSLLALSWLFGGTATEILTAIIFLFVKHPYDCGDRVDVDTYQFTVKEIQLLSTVFMTTTGKTVQVSHAILNTKYIENVRRSGQMSEPFTFDVAYGTSFEQIEQLRQKMLAFVTSERRDFLPQFDVTVQDIPDQTKLILSALIRYKSNWQQVALQAQRRNKWMCALKQSLHDLKIYGPAGDPAPPPATNHVTLVPWEEVKPKTEPALPSPTREPLLPKSDWNLSDKNAVLRDDDRDVFGVADELQSSTVRGMRYGTPGSTQPGTRVATPETPGVPMSATSTRPPRSPIPPVPALPGARRFNETEEYEMTGSTSRGV